MLTRRTFFASLAALAVWPRVSVAAPVVPVIGGIDTALRSHSGAPQAPTAFGENPYLDTKMRALFDSCRRDDGDTILELR